MSIETMKAIALEMGFDLIQKEQENEHLQKEIKVCKRDLEDTVASWAAEQKAMTEEIRQLKNNDQDLRAYIRGIQKSVFPDRFKDEQA